MAVKLTRDRYRVDLLGLHSTYELNYARLLRLLPEMRKHYQERRVALSQGEQALGVLLIRVLEVNPYTTTLEIRQEHSLPWLPVPCLEVRAYHDAKMAEVICADGARRLRSIYTYPNPAMHQPDEKSQLNLFLGEWLSHSLACGHTLEQLI